MNVSCPGRGPLLGVVQDAEVSRPGLWSPEDESLGAKQRQRCRNQLRGARAGKDGEVGARHQGGRPPDPDGQVLRDKGLQGVRSIPCHLTPVLAARPRASAQSLSGHTAQR